MTLQHVSSSVKGLRRRKPPEAGSASCHSCSRFGVHGSAQLQGACEVVALWAGEGRRGGGAEHLPQERSHMLRMPDLALDLASLPPTNLPGCRLNHYLPHLTFLLD